MNSTHYYYELIKKSFHKRAINLFSVAFSRTFFHESTMGSTCKNDNTAKKSDDILLFDGISINNKFKSLLLTQEVLCGGL